MDRPVLSAYLLWTIRFDRPIAENSPILPVYQLRTIRFYRSIAQQTIRFQPLSLQRHRERSTIPQAKDVLPAVVASESPSKISMFSFVVIDIYS